MVPTQSPNRLRTLDGGESESEVEWSAFCKDFNDTMDKFGVPTAERDELFVIVQGTKGPLQQQNIFDPSVVVRQSPVDLYTDTHFCMNGKYFGSPDPSNTSQMWPWYL